MKQFNRDIMGRLVTYFTQRLGVYQHKTGWLRQGVCPSCSKPKKFGVNLWLNRTNCFSCGYHPQPLLLIMKLENLDTYNQVYTYLNAFEGAEYLEGNIPMLEEKEVMLPESFRLLSLGHGTIPDLARGYMQNRGYNIRELSLRGVGYCTKGEYQYRIIIPYYQRGKLIYFNARQFIQLGAKHKNPPVTDFGIGKSQIIYNVDCLHIYKTTYMVESATNALTLGDKGFGTGGKLVSEWQLSTILRSPCRNIVILMDPDAWWEALHTGLQLARHKRVKVVKIPNYLPEKDKENPDVNDLGKKHTLELVKQTPYMSYQDIYRQYIVAPKPLHRLPVA